MIIDAHHHCLPIDVYKKFHDPYAPPKRVVVEDNDFVFNSRLHDLKEHIEAMDYAGVDMSLLTIAQYGNLGSPALCREINEGLAAEVEKYPGRFVAAGCVPVTNVKAAMDEIDYQIRELKFPAISLLASQGPDINLSNKELMWPVYKKAMEYDAPIFIHPHLKPHGIELECTINRSIGRGFDAAKAALRLLYDVLPDFPELKFCLPHYGGALLGLKGRIMNFFEPPEELGLPVPKIGHNLAKTPLELEEMGYYPAFDNIFDKMYIDGAGSGGWQPITDLAFSTVKHNRLVWGTDYPYEIHAGRDLKYYIDNVRAMTTISEEEKDAFLGGNLAELLKL